MAGPGNNPFGDGDKNISRPAESANRVGDSNASQYTKDNGQDNLKIIRGQENQHSYPESSLGKSNELSPKAALQKELNHLLPSGDHHNYTVTIRQKDGGPYVDIKGGDTASFNKFYDNVQLHCNESFWNNINKLTAGGQKVDFSVGGTESQKPQDHPTQSAEHSAMQKLEPKLDTPAKPAADTVKPKDADSQIIDSKLANLIPAGVHLKFTQNNGQFHFAPDKYVDPQHWAPIEHAIQKNPDLVNALIHKMGSHGQLDIASGHKQETHSSSEVHTSDAAEQTKPGNDQMFKFKAAVNDLNASAQTFGGGAQESFEPMFLGGKTLINGLEVRLIQRSAVPIPANASDGYPINARCMQNTAGISSMQGQLHTEGGAKSFRVQTIVYADGTVDQGADLADVPLTKQNKDGVAKY